MEKKFEMSTFNMWVSLKEKAKIFIAAHNRSVKERGTGSKLNLGLLINKALDYYLKDVEIKD